MVPPSMGQETQGEQQVGGKIAEDVDTELSFKVPRGTPMAPCQEASRLPRLRIKRESSTRNINLRALLD